MRRPRPADFANDPAKGNERIDHKRAARRSEIAQSILILLAAPVKVRPQHRVQFRHGLHDLAAPRAGRGIGLLHRLFEHLRNLRLLDAHITHGLRHNRLGAAWAFLVIIIIILLRPVLRHCGACTQERDEHRCIPSHSCAVLQVMLKPLVKAAKRPVSSPTGRLPAMRMCANHMTNEIGSSLLRAAVNPLGAELCSLRDADDRELMTDADAAFWASHSPLLFPIIGELNGSTYRHDSQSYTMPRHGIARREMFQLIEQAPDRLSYRLNDNATTRQSYPFAFHLDATYRIEGASLLMQMTAHNPGDVDLPASFGFHPGLGWPLPFGQARQDHRILFDKPEPAALCLLDAGLIASEDRPSPVEGRTLNLHDDLFTDDALIWRQLESRACLYGAAQGPQLHLEWSDMPSLGIWTKPGARFICIEPWDGIADRDDFYGDIWQKPGIRAIAPGASYTWWMRITLLNGKSA